MPDTTVVCCIEAGKLEAQTLLMLASLRSFGGALADVPMLAVQPRRGPDLSPRTVEAMHRLGVELVLGGTYRTGFRWFNYSNKVRAVEAAQAQASTGQIIWLDSDVLVTGDLSGLVLEDDIDVAVRPEAVLPSVSERERTELAYWRSLAQTVGVDFDRVPWIEQDGTRKLAYFNSGVMVWRRNSTFAQAYVQAFNRLLGSRLAQSNGSFFAADQVIISAVIAKENLRWRPLAEADHRMVFPALLQSDMRSWSGSNLLHYSGSRYGDLKPIFSERLRSEMPVVAEWVAGNEPEETGPSGPGKIMAKTLKFWRHLHWRLYEARLRRAPANDRSPLPKGAVTVVPD